MDEIDLYKPIKTYFERHGYVVKSEIKNCDVVAIKGDETPIIIEMKLNFSLTLLMQGIDRQLISEFVYLAFPVKKGKYHQKLVKDAIKICRRLGLGLLTIRLTPTEFVRVHCEPGLVKVNKSKERSKVLLDEFNKVLGDPNVGGQVGKSIMTAYRQDAICIAKAIISGEEGKPSVLVNSLGILNSGSILNKNYYGWFYKIKYGLYGVSIKGKYELNNINDNKLKD